MSVKANISQRVIPTYPLGEPEKNPLFFEKRVYQGSSGKVYPLPFIDKVYDEPEDREYRVAVLENEYVYLEMLPEIGGRIFAGQDKTNDNYDFFYRQDVIKPALVGLAGPWISGGVEFNWPQHHRPSTYMPTDVYIEKESDGARTVWMSELDPMKRMKGMHGVRLRPGSSLIELRVRLFNRTPVTQTFLWWANVAAKVHDHYQSFFPPDVHYVADHAVRAMSSFPIAENLYYGVDYAARAGANDLSWYRNIPVPTSYMVCETRGGFFGGYDFDKQGGFVHVADKRLSPGKKQWTWGNHEFGWAWDRELTDQGGPYVELMAGVYTDNQPDFSYLLPYETKTFSQFWWPIQKIGPVQEANELVALRLIVRDDRVIEAAVNVSRPQQGLRLQLEQGGRVLLNTQLDLEPGEAWASSDLQFTGEDASELRFSVSDRNGRLLASYSPEAPARRERSREVAKAPAAPSEIESVDSLFIVGEHLEQYRHPTRDPETYWQEGLRRDPGDARCNLALGKSAFQRGELEVAYSHFKASIARLTQYHPNPATGEAHYYAGVARRFQGRLDEAYELLYKATWNFEWRSAAHYELGCIDFLKERYEASLSHALRSLETNTQNNKASVLESMARLELGDRTAAIEALTTLLHRDPLDAWATWELDRLKSDQQKTFQDRFRNDAQTALDVALDYAAIGAFAQAIELLEWHQSSDFEPTATPNPLGQSRMTVYVLAWLKERVGEAEVADRLLGEAAALSADYLFPSRLEEQLILEWACQRSDSWVPRYGLGNYYYDKRRHADAIAQWEGAATAGADYPTVYRNLGIAYWNVRRDGKLARNAYERAVELGPEDARLIFEYDQLRKRLGDAVDERLRYLESKRQLVATRDDACVELATLLNEVGRHDDALSLLESRRFHPWEGGEGKVLRQYTGARIGLGRRKLEEEDYAGALTHFQEAFNTPENLGEAYHFLQAKADVNYWIGLALQGLGRESEARQSFEASGAEGGDFKDTAVVAFSDQTYYQGLSLIALGRYQEAAALFRAMLAHIEEELETEAKIDFFATSLPNLLVFDDDLQETRDAALESLRELAISGLKTLKEKENYESV